MLRDPPGKAHFSVGTRLLQVADPNLILKDCAH